MSERYVHLDNESLYDLMQSVNSVTTITNACDGTYVYRLVNIVPSAINALRTRYIAVLEDRRSGYTAVPKELQ